MCLLTCTCTICDVNNRYPGNYGRYLELKEARIAAEDADADRARTKLRRESEWMAKQPRARQAKSKARQQQFYELVDKAKGREADKAKVTYRRPVLLLDDGCPLLSTCAIPVMSSPLRWCCRPRRRRRSRSGSEGWWQSSRQRAT